MLNVMLTTTDNPFNPWHSFDEWRAFDDEKGYNTLEYLARVAHASDEMSLADEELAVETAINEIIELNALGIYRTISKEDSPGLLEETSII